MKMGMIPIFINFSSNSELLFDDFFWAIAIEAGKK